MALMATEPVTRRTPRPVRVALMRQWWRDVTFVHWAVEPAAVAGLLPAGTRPDVFDGTTYVGLVPFTMHRVLGLPYLGTFRETNVRLYSVDDAGRRGVVFLSLDASRLLPALIGRVAVGLPYVWSSMRLRHSGDTVTYTCWRRSDPREHSRLRVRVGEPIEPSELELFLTARWGLHVSWHGRTLYLRNEHPQWTLHRAELIDIDDRLVDVPRHSAPTSVLYSPGVPVRFGR